MAKLSTVFSNTKEFFDALYNSTLSTADKTWFFRTFLNAISADDKIKFWNICTKYFDSLAENVFDYESPEIVDAIKIALSDKKTFEALTAHVISQADGQAINDPIWNSSKELLESVDSPTGYYYHADKGMVKVRETISTEKDPRGIYKMDLFNFAYANQNDKKLDVYLTTRDLDSFQMGKWSDKKFNQLEYKVGQYLIEQDYDFGDFYDEYDDLCSSCLAENNGMIGAYNLAEAKDNWYSSDSIDDKTQTFEVRIFPIEEIAEQLTDQINYFIDYLKENGFKNKQSIVKKVDGMAAYMHHNPSDYVIDALRNTGIFGLENEDYLQSCCDDFFCKKLEVNFPKQVAITTNDVAKAVGLPLVVVAGNVALKRIYDYCDEIGAATDDSMFINDVIEDELMDNDIGNEPYIEQQLSEAINVALQTYPVLMKFDKDGLLTDAD